MTTKNLSLAQKLKISCFSRGISLTTNAIDHLTCGGRIPLSIHEYATTGGVTMIVDNEIYVNAPLDEWFCTSPEAILDADERSGDFIVRFRNETFPARTIKLPFYLNEKDSKGRLVSDTVMSHADRARISPILGCSFGCEFCDYIGKKYIRRPLDQILEGVGIAIKDTNLPAKHVMISGGTPSPRDQGYIEEVYEQVIRQINLPVDVMFMPRSVGIIERLVGWGVYGFSINLEVYNTDYAQKIVPQKYRLGRKLFTTCIEEALARTGGNGRVRSLLLVGIEPVEETLKGVEFLASIGCDPVLSPFRPAKGTPLQTLRPPSSDILEKVYLECLDITERYGVKLGPRCIPCQHNTLTFPDRSGYYFS